jgi:hypothetical protein
MVLAYLPLLSIQPDVPERLSSKVRVGLSSLLLTGISFLALHHCIRILACSRGFLFTGYCASVFLYVSSPEGYFPPPFSQGTVFCFLPRRVLSSPVVASLTVPRQYLIQIIKVSEFGIFFGPLSLPLNN